VSRRESSAAKLQTLPRITMTIKGFEEDTKHKASMFEEELSIVMR